MINCIVQEIKVIYKHILYTLINRLMVIVLIVGAVNMWKKWNYSIKTPLVNLEHAGLPHPRYLQENPSNF